MSACRCGWDGEGAHLCHRCHERPGERRYYIPTWLFSLAGAQMKASAVDTIACDACWKEFAQILARRLQQERRAPR